MDGDMTGKQTVSYKKIILIQSDTQDTKSSFNAVQNFENLMWNLIWVEARRENRLQLQDEKLLDKRKTQELEQSNWMNSHTK